MAYGQRELNPEDYPMVNDHGVLRVAQEHDLMNLGLFRARDGDTDFAAVEPFADRRGQHKPGAELPGRCIASGPNRHQKVPKDMKIEGRTTTGLKFAGERHR